MVSTNSLGQVTTGRRYPDATHRFQPGTSPSTATESGYFDNVAEAVVTDLADWVEGFA